MTTLTIMNFKSGNTFVYLIIHLTCISQFTHGKRGCSFEEITHEFISEVVWIRHTHPSVNLAVKSKCILGGSVYLIPHCVCARTAVTFRTATSAIIVYYRVTRLIARLNYMAA